MIKRSPQEIADFFGCYVFQGRSRDSFYMTQGKPAWDGADFCLHCDGILSLIDEGLVDIPENHDWTYLYEPRPYSTEQADSDNKQDAYSGKQADSDNKHQSDNAWETHEKTHGSTHEASHQSQVHVHAEYCIVTNINPVGLSEHVHELVSEGWRPQGGVAVEHLPKSEGYAEECCYHQAMVRGIS